MDRRTRRLMGAGALVVAIAIAAPALAATTRTAHKRVHFKESLVGASISSSQAVYMLHGSLGGDGAAVSTSTSDTTDTGVAYYVGGSVVFRDTFTISAPSPQGIATITGTGHDFGGTGRFKHIHSSYSFTGTDDTKTGVMTISLEGTETH